MDNTQQAYWEVREAIEKQANRRKTIDKELIQRLLVLKTNCANMHNTDAEFLRVFNSDMHDLLHSFSCYGGYNNRGWIAFCSFPNWYAIVKKLQSLDDGDPTRKHYSRMHYWKLIRYLDNVIPGLFHYGGGIGFVPTSREKRIAERLHRRYCQALGIEEG